MQEETKDQTNIQQIYQYNISLGEGKWVQPPFFFRKKYPLETLNICGNMNIGFITFPCNFPYGNLYVGRSSQEKNIHRALVSIQYNPYDIRKS